MKNIRLPKASFASVSASVILLSSAANADTFYTNGGTSDNLVPSTGSSWNTQADGLGSGGVSSTYNIGTNDLVFQSGDFMYTANGSVTFDFNATSYTLDGGSLVNNLSSGSGLATFSGGDITVTANGGTFYQAGPGTREGEAVGGVGGTSNLQLGSNAITLRSRFSSSDGIYDFGLNVVGDGDIDLEFSNASTGFVFSNLSSDFTGRILANRFSGEISFAAGDGALNTDLLLSRSNANDLGGGFTIGTSGQLNLVGDFSVANLNIDGQGNIAAGIYDYDDLVAINGEFANNLIDGGGRVHVGQAVPEPSSAALLFGAAAGGAMLLRRRR